MAAAYKAILVLNPVKTAEEIRYDSIGKFPGNFPSTAEEERETSGIKEAQKSTDATEFKRELVFKSNQRTHEIGRASSNPSRGLIPNKDNGYFFSPVMSRNHAMVKMRRQKLYIVDRGSMHGTFHNGNCVKEAEKVELKTGDYLSFGMQITRGNEVYDPKEFECEVSWEQIQPSLPAKPGSPYLGGENRRRSCGYGVTDEDLIVSEDEMEMEWSSDRDDDETDEEMGDNQATENEEDSYDEFDDYYDEDDYMDETEVASTAVSSSAASSLPDASKGLFKAQKETEVKTGSSAKAKDDAPIIKWQNLVMDKASDLPPKAQEKTEMDREPRENDHEKVRANKFSIGSLMNEIRTPFDSPVAAESLVSDDEAEEWHPGTKSTENAEVGRGTKLAPISLLDDDVEREDSFDISSEEETGEDKVELSTDCLSHKEIESEEDEPPEVAGVKGDEIARKTNGTEGVLFQAKSNSVLETIPVQKDSSPMKPAYPLLPPPFQNRSSTERAAPIAYDFLHPSESLQAVIKDAPKKPDNKGSAGHPEAQTNQQSPHTTTHESDEALPHRSCFSVPEHLKHYFAAREANAAALADVHRAAKIRDLASIAAFHGTDLVKAVNNSSASRSQAQPLPWVQRYPAAHIDEGSSPCGLFPVIPAHQEKQGQAQALSAKLSESCNIKKPNLYEQILSSEETKKKQAIVDGMKADLERMKASFQGYVEERAPWPIAGESLLYDAPYESEIEKEMDEDLEEIHPDIRTHNSEAGSNAASTERRNTSLIYKLNNASSTVECDSASKPTICHSASLKPADPPAARCPISSLVNQQPVESAAVPSGSLMSNSQVHELDVTPTNCKKRKYEDDGADQKEVAEKEESPLSIISDDDVPKEVTVDIVMNDVASMNLITNPESANRADMAPPRKKQRTWPTIATSFALGAAMGGVGVFAALVASAPN